MIECSICHVMNEDSARFCAECGQRLVTADQPAEAETFNIQSEAAPAAPSFTQAPLAMPEPMPTVTNVTPMEAAPAPSPSTPPSSSEPAATPPAALPTAPTPPRLRSPLLSGDDEPDSDTQDRIMRLRPGRQQSNSPTSSSPRGLRSPLLGGNEDDDSYSDSFDTPPPKSGGLRSPLLGGDDFDSYDDQPSTGSHLHSPLLEGDDTHNKSSFNAGSRPGHLRSPLLGQDYDQEEDFIDEQVSEDNTNVLRSPLLQSRVQMGDRQKLTPSGPGGQVPDAEPKISADKAAILQKLEQSKYGAPTAPAAEQSGTSSSSQLDIGIGVPGDKTATGQSAFRSPDPFANSTPAPSTNNWPSINQSPAAEVIAPPDRSGTNPWAARSAEPKGPEKTDDSSLLGGKQASGDTTTAGGASWVDIKIGGSAAMPGSSIPGSTSGSTAASTPGSLAGSLPGSQGASTPAAMPFNQPGPGSSESANVPPAPAKQPRLQSKLLAHDNEDMEAPAPSASPSLRRFGESKSFPGPGPEHAGVIQFFVICLYIGIAMKLWLIYDFFRGGSLSPSLLGDELGQIVGMLFLVYLGSIYTKPSS